MTPLVDKTPAQHVAALLQGGASLADRETPEMRIVLRAPASTVAFVDAFAERGERSRNFMLCNLLVVAIQAVLDELPEAERDSLQVAWLNKQADLVERAE